MLSAERVPSGFCNLSVGVFCLGVIQGTSYPVKGFLYYLIVEVSVRYKPGAIKGDMDSIRIEVNQKERRFINVFRVEERFLFQHLLSEELRNYAFCWMTTGNE
ncbi:hypothetical protein P8452_23521 [Trifolium repens]|nr:hypothetical protein P8452_23521 [Trifolium repens]